MRGTVNWHSGVSVSRRLVTRLSVASCAVLALLLLAAAGPAGTAAAHARTPTAPHSCGLAIGASRTDQTSAQHAASAPRLTLSPSHGAAGTKITVTGSGWPQGASVNVTAQAGGQAILTQPAGSATVQADGSFALTLAAPGDNCTFIPAMGQVIQIVATTDTGARTASANFTFDVPSPVLANPAEDGQLVPSATKLAVRGSNWGAGTAVTVWSTTPSALANVRDLWQPPQGIPTVVLTADAAGQIVGSVPVPSTLLPLRPGALLGLAASAHGPGYGQAITFLPTAYHVVLGEQPTLLVSQVTAAQGDALRVSGDHWWPGDTVQVMYCGGAPKPANAAAVRCNPAMSTTLGTAQVDATGHFAARVTIPAQAATGSGTLEASVSGEYDDPFTSTQALHVTASFNPGVWLAGMLGPAAPLMALALLALAGVLAALWWIARQRPAQRAAQRG